MKVIAGAFPDRRREGGYASLGLVLVLFGLIIVGVMLAPNLVLKINARNREQESFRLARIREGLVTSMQQAQVVPAAAGWSAAAASALGMDQTEVEQVFPAFASDTNIRRVLLIDPGLGATTLPYTQTVAGVSGSATNLLGASSRLILVSNTKRSLTLPVTNGIPALASFDAVWNWHSCTEESILSRAKCICHIKFLWNFIMNGTYYQHRKFYKNLFLYSTHLPCRELPPDKSK